MKKKIPATRLDNTRQSNFENYTVLNNFPSFNPAKNSFQNFLGSSKAGSLFDSFHEIGIGKPLGQSKYAHSDLGNSIRINDSFLDESFSADRYQKVMKMVQKINKKVNEHDEWISKNEYKLNQDLKLYKSVKDEVEKQVKLQIKLSQGLKIQSQNFKRQLLKNNIKEDVQKLFKVIKQETDSQILKISQKIKEIKNDMSNLKNIENKNYEKSINNQYQGQVQQIFNELRTKLNNVEKILAIARPHTIKNYKYLGKAHILKYNEYITVVNEKKTQTVSIFQSEYKVDNQGYLLDIQQNYLVDFSNRMIKLDQEHLNILKKNQMLQ